MRRLAIMGGTFDPIHTGHVRIAKAVRRQMDFHRIVMLPAARPPHKQQRSDFASEKDRLEMVRLAFEDDGHFTVSDMEFRRGGLSYTYDTVCAFQEMWPDAELYLIIGEDSVVQLLTWYKNRELLERVYFIAAERPGYSSEKDIENMAQKYGAWVKDKFIPAQVPETGISSTEIRERVAQGLPIRGMVPLKVEEYIYKNGLYKKS